MTIFYRNSFDEGRWAGALAGLLKRKKYVPGLKPDGRVWRASWHQQGEMGSGLVFKHVRLVSPTCAGPVFPVALAMSTSSQ